ncbi:MAG: hypothetical protein WAP03_01930 [Methylorubrum rhodinum]|uniref:HNH endonuclease n=1 Tax=Methylorubrum rhodinum TaxID=29428 RepID=UPI003BB18D35
MASNVKTFDSRLPIRLHNVACIYCGDPLIKGENCSKEHVVGRNFVPKHEMLGQWNIVALACISCNNIKANLEDDISAITLIPEMGENHEDIALASISMRKSHGARSRKTNKPVYESSMEREINLRMGHNALSSFGLIAPPQIAPDRAELLASFHAQGFFYFLSYDEESRSGGYILNHTKIVNIAGRPDWGNQIQISFARLASGWPQRISTSTANGFFNIAIRKDPSHSALWSFAVEWNKSFRIIGFFGETERSQIYVDSFGSFVWKNISPTLRIREEIPIKDEDDILFDDTGFE